MLELHIKQIRNYSASEVSSTVQSSLQEDQIATKELDGAILTFGQFVFTSSIANTCGFLDGGHHHVFIVFEGSNASIYDEHGVQKYVHQFTTPFDTSDASTVAAQVNCLELGAIS